MSALVKSLSDMDKNTLPNGKTYRLGIVVSEYYSEITDALKDACVATLLECGVLPQNIYTESAPGTFELPLSASLIYKRHTPDAVICIGCVLKGETRHFDFICSTVTNAIMNLGLQHNTPFIFGVLTPDTLQQAQDRAGGRHGNKGIEAAVAALKMIALHKKLM